MCRCVAVTLGSLLLFSCTTRKQLTAALHEEVRRVVETHLADTVRKHSVEQEREQTRWCIDVVREWVETADTLASRVADTPRVAEHWTIRAVSTRERLRVDSLHEERLLTTQTADSSRFSAQVAADAQRQTGGGVSWILYAIVVVLSIVSVGLVFKR